jgi:hypothetical protein
VTQQRQHNQQLSLSQGGCFLFFIIAGDAITKLIVMYNLEQITSDKDELRA